MTAARREYRRGDRVVVLRTGPAGRRGTFGSVIEVEAGRRVATVSWDPAPAPVKMGVRDMADVGYGYAATPALVRYSELPVLLLGPPEAAPELHDRLVVAAWCGGVEVSGLSRAIPTEPGLEEPAAAGLAHRSRDSHGYELAL